MDRRGGSVPGSTPRRESRSRSPPISASPRSPVYPSTLSERSSPVPPIHVLNVPDTQERDGCGALRQTKRGTAGATLRCARIRRRTSALTALSALESAALPISRWTLNPVEGRPAGKRAAEPFLNTAALRRSIAPTGTGRRSSVSNEMEMTTELPRRTVLIALSLSAISLCVWIVFIGSRSRPIERRVSNIALSTTGKWLAAGTSQGKITVWDQGSGTAPRQIDFPRGSLNDLQFDPDERLLAIAAGDLGLYAPEQPAGPRFLRSDGRNYGTVLFSRDGQTVLVITGTGLIETIGIHSGATQLKVCCSTIYGEVAFTPDGQAIANAGHWPSLWDARSGRLIARLTKDRQFYTFRPIAFDGSRGAVLMGSQDGRVYAWDLTTRQLVAISAPQSEYVDTLAVSTTGWVVYAGFGKMLRLWNPPTGRERSFPAARPTSNLILSPDGASIIFGTADGEIEFWDVGTGQRLRAIKVPGS